MDQTTEYRILLTVTERTRQRLNMVKAAIQLQRGGLANPTWSDTIEWLSETVPIPELLAELCKPAQPEAPKEN